MLQKKDEDNYAQDVNKADGLINFEEHEQTALRESKEKDIELGSLLGALDRDSDRGEGDNKGKIIVLEDGGEND